MLRLYLGISLAPIVLSLRVTSPVLERLLHILRLLWTLIWLPCLRPATTVRLPARQNSPFSNQGIERWTTHELTAKSPSVPVRISARRRQSSTFRLRLSRAVK